MGADRLIDLRIHSDRYGDLLLGCHSETLNGTDELVPDFTRENAVVIAKWLWHLDLELTYDRDPEAPSIPYLLTDLLRFLGGGVYTYAIPTDYGKSTAIEMSVVTSLLMWPKDSTNAIIKANEDAAVAAARTCWWKLRLASEFLPYARPLSTLRQGNPEVKKGFWIEGSELRTFGGRDTSVYPAGIGDSSLPGRRGRAHFDDLETENILKSEAKTDTLMKQVNACVRLIQRHPRMLFLICGTPQGANSLIYLIKDDIASINLPMEAIIRSEDLPDGRLLWPAARIKAELQAQLMDETAYQIAYKMKPPGVDRYNGERTVEVLKDPGLAWPENEQAWRQTLEGWFYQRLLEQLAAGPVPGLGHAGDVQVRAQQEAQLARIYVGWDPAASHTFALSLVCISQTARFILRSVIAPGTPDEQAILIRRWRQDWPSLTVILEKDAQQLAFAHVLMHLDPWCPWAPHQTTGYNKDSKYVGIPVLMQELQRGLWKLPWPNDDWGEEQFGKLLLEIRRWGPTAHPHGIPSIWFCWHFEHLAETPGSKELQNQDFTVQPVVIESPGSFRDPIQVVRGWPSVSEESEEAWARRWPSLR